MRLRRYRTIRDGHLDSRAFCFGSIKVERNVRRFDRYKATLDVEWPGCFMVTWYPNERGPDGSRQHRLLVQIGRGWFGVEVSLLPWRKAAR